MPKLDDLVLGSAGFIDAAVEYSPINFLTENMFGIDLNPHLAPYVYATQEASTKDEQIRLKAAAIAAEDDGKLLDAAQHTIDDIAESGLSIVKFLKIAGIVAAAGFGIYLGFRAYKAVT